MRLAMYTELLWQMPWCKSIIYMKYNHSTLYIRNKSNQLSSEEVPECTLAVAVMKFSPIYVSCMSMCACRRVRHGHLCALCVCTCVAQNWVCVNIPAAHFKEQQWWSSAGKWLRPHRDHRKKSNRQPFFAASQLDRGFASHPPLSPSNPLRPSIHL